MTTHDDDNLTVSRALYIVAEELAKGAPKLLLAAQADGKDLVYIAGMSDGLGRAEDLMRFCARGMEVDGR